MKSATNLNSEMPVHKGTYDVDFGFFALIEFIGAHKKEIGDRFKTAIDIGSGAGVHTEILRHAGLEVFQVDKYSESAEFRVDFMEHEFEQKFDIIFCSHVIEHQRNVGAFLDKIYDIMGDDGLLLLGAPKHPAERMVEGHLNCFFASYFVQQLIHAGFDCNKGKFLCCSGIENAAIVPKASNFCLSERQEAGFKWTANHQERSFLKLQNEVFPTDELFFHNCEVLSATGKQSLNLNRPTNEPKLGIQLTSNRFNLSVNI